MPDSDQIWIVIPAFDEAEVVAGVVAGVRSSYPNVVVVDDCSRDRTGADARAAGAVVLRHVVNLGQGAALQTGIRYALLRGARYIVTFDADGQHRPEDIEVLLATQQSTGADVVMGSRFLGAATDIPRVRRLLLDLAVRYTRATSGIPLSDTHNGLRLFTRHAAQRLRITQNRMAHASEIIDQVARLGLAVAEAPVTVVYSPYSLRKGQKSVGALNVLAELLVARLNK